MRSKARVGCAVGVAAVVCCVAATILPAAWAAGDEVGKIEAIQNEVQTKAASAGDWEPSSLHEALHERDRVRTGPASRAAILYSDQTLQRINEKSEVEVQPPTADNPGFLRVISGTHYFSSRKPKDYGRIETPTVTAAIRGTEFVVEVAEGGATTITMLEGVVDASNTFGRIEIGRGEQAYVEPGKAPVRRIAVRPRDAVSWSLFYPRVLGGADARRLQSMGPEGQSLERAAQLLSAGQVDGALPLIEGVRERQPRNPVALALASVIEVAGDHKDEALRLAEQAVDAGPDSPAAALALSFAAQARFDVRRARAMAERAATLDPESSEAQARAAELRMAEGDVEGAERAARQAVQRDPGNARALTVLGFVQLALFRSEEAQRTFERAVEADSSFALGHLGLGIARMRNGDLAAGREEMQTAVILDPDDALLRSYLAKAYYEEKRDAEAAKELETAKDLDPLDPTPFLYDAIRLQNDNRPVEALDNLQESIARNDRRAVYRSRLLLDQDQAVRSSDLARVYNDLGFEQLGMVTARRSADADQSNFSSHLFLAGNYRELPGFAPAFLSETLQARIYQPANVNAVRPDVVNETVSYNEYTALFDRPRLRVFGGAVYGDTNTNLSELFPPGAMCFDPGSGMNVPCAQLVELNSSNSSGGNVVATLNRDRFAGALSYTTFDDDGFRINNDVKNDVFRGFFTFAPTYRDTFQVNVIDGKRKTGDLPLREIPPLISPQRLETNLTNVGFGYHRVISPSADLAVSAIYNKTEQTGTNTLFDTSTTATLDGPQIEAQYVWRQESLTWIAGGGHFDGTDELRGTDALGSPISVKGDDTFSNAYLYVKLRDLGPVEITAGAAYEDVSVPVGLLPPRDSNIIPGDVQYSESKLSPKVGVSVYLGPKTVLRGSAYYRLSPAIGRLQTLEPTQVAGFNQFFDEPGGTWSFTYGAGIDQEFTKRLFGGVSVARRDLEIQEPTCAAPSDFSGCGFQVASGLVQRTSNDWLGSAYFNVTLGRRVAAAVEYAYEKRDFNFTQVSPVGFFEDFQRTERLRPQVRVFLPFGLFAGVRATRFDQRVDQFDDLSSPVRTPMTANFWIADLQVGYRFPERWGSVVLEARNVTDKAFVFFRSSLEDDIVPSRRITLSLNFTY